MKATKASSSVTNSSLHSKAASNGRFRAIPDPQAQTFFLFYCSSGHRHIYLSAMHSKVNSLPLHLNQSVPFKQRHPKPCRPLFPTYLGSYIEIKKPQICWKGGENSYSELQKYTLTELNCHYYTTLLLHDKNERSV